LESGVADFYKRLFYHEPLASKARVVQFRVEEREFVGK
jgi:hypothetical protein